MMSDASDPSEKHEADGGPPAIRLGPGLCVRAGVGGALMGLANLVPGISGGTMLVAAGIYRAFIESIAEVTRLRLKPGPVGVLAIVVTGALAAIALFAGVIGVALEQFRWGMYSLFIGLTLGGVPILLAMARPLNTPAIAGLAAGLVAMLTLVYLQGGEDAGAAGGGGTGMLFIGGVAGAAAMILPGVSGAYLLLLLGQYEPIVDAIRGGVIAAREMDVPAGMDHAMVLAPVGFGVVVGVGVVSHALRYVLRRHEKLTLGVLLGLLIGAPAGLYPFKEGVPPEPGDVHRGAVLSEEDAETMDPRKWPERAFRPTAFQVGGAAGLAGFGFVITMGVARLGRERPRRDA